MNKMFIDGQRHQNAQSQWQIQDFPAGTCRRSKANDPFYFCSHVISRRKMLLTLRPLLVRRSSIHPRSDQQTTRNTYVIRILHVHLTATPLPSYLKSGDDDASPKSIPLDSPLQHTVHSTPWSYCCETNNIAPWSIYRPRTVSRAICHLVPIHSSSDLTQQCQWIARWSRCVGYMNVWSRFKGY